MKTTALWAALTALVVGLLALMQWAIGYNYQIVAVTFVVGTCLTLRSATATFVPALIAYVASLNSVFSKLAEPYLMQKVLGDSSAKKQRAPIAWGLLSIVIWIVWILACLVCLTLTAGPMPVMLWKTEHLIHSICTFFVRVTSGFGGLLATVLWAIFTIASIWITVRAGLQLTQLGKSTSVTLGDLLKPIRVMLIAWAVPHIYAWLYFGYGVYRIIQDVLYWLTWILIIVMATGLILAIDYAMTKSTT